MTLAVCGNVELVTVLGDEAEGEAFGEGGFEAEGDDGVAFVEVEGVEEEFGRFKDFESAVDLPFEFLGSTPLGKEGVVACHGFELKSGTGFPGEEEVVAIDHAVADPGAGGEAVIEIFDGVVFCGDAGQPIGVGGEVAVVLCGAENPFGTANALGLAVLAVKFEGELVVLAFAGGGEGHGDEGTFGVARVVGGTKGEVAFPEA